MRFRIWRPAVAPSDAAKTKSNIGAQLQSLRCTTPPNIFWKIYFLYDLMRTNLFVTSHFWTTCTNFDNCCQRYIATCGKIIQQVHICILGHELLRWNFLQIPQLSIRSCMDAQTFPPIF